MQRHQLHNGLRQDAGAAQGQGADLDNTLQAAANGGEVSVNVAQLVQRPADREQNVQTGPCRQQTTGRALEQRFAAAAFKYLEGRTDGGLAQAQQAGHGLHMVGFAEFDEHLQASGLKQIQRLVEVFVGPSQQCRHRFQLGQYAPRPRQQTGAVIGQAHAVGVTFKQGHAEARFQFANRAGDHGLRPEQRLRGFGHAAVIGHPDKGAHVHQARQFTGLHKGRLAGQRVRRTMPLVPWSGNK